MPSFGITPASGYPPATDQGFPRFIQWQINGVDIGSRETVETVDLVGDVQATVNSGGDKVTYQFGPIGLVWNEIEGDYVITADDAENGIAAMNVSGAQVVTIPSDGTADIDPGKAVLVYADGGAAVQFVAESGVLLRYRADFLPEIAGQFGIVTLIKRAADEWLLCGDMALA